MNKIEGSNRKAVKSRTTSELLDTVESEPKKMTRVNFKDSVESIRYTLPNAQIMISR